MRQSNNYNTSQMQKMQRRKDLFVSLPDSLDFGFVAVQVPFQYHFTLQNHNDFALPFAFKCQTFRTQPASGVLSAHSKQSCTVNYIAHEAVVHVGTMILESEGQAPRIFKFSVIGKWAYLSLSAQKLNFEKILVGKSYSKQVLIKNNSLVSAKFTVVRQSEDQLKDNFFSLSTMEGVIPAKKSFILQVKFTPNLVKLFSIARFLVKCEGGNTCSFQCSGEGAGFEVRLSDVSMNFGDVKLGSSTSRLMTIHNDMDLATFYQFNCEEGNVFGFNQPRGLIPANSYKRVTVEYSPRKTINYYQRVYLQIHQNPHLLFVDLLGSCSDLLVRPIPIMQGHIELFRRRVAEGHISEIDLKYIENSLLLRIQSSDQEVQRIKHSQPVEKEVALYKEMFQDVRSSQRLISVSDEFLDFGYSEPMMSSTGQEITVTNQLSTKLHLFWVTQKRQGINGEMLSVFQVHPDNGVLRPRSSAKFLVTFRPFRTGAYFCQTVQFFAIRYNSKMTMEKLEQFERKYHKLSPEISVTKNIKLSQTLTQKVFDQVAASEMLPPFEGHVTAMGHTFRDTAMPFIPMIEPLPNSKVTFVPCSPGQSQYQTVQLLNKTDTHTFFSISEEIQRTFRAYPSRGLIESNSFALIHIQFCPKEPRIYNSVLVVQLNYAQSSVRLELIGLCSKPALQLQSQGYMLFPPSHMGVLSRRTIKVKNNSRLHSSIQSKVPQKYKEQIFIDPPFKILQPLETALLEVSFVPYHKKKYKIKVPLLTEEVLDKDQELAGYWKPGSSGIPLPEPLQDMYELEIHGSGGDGCMILQPGQINFGVVKVSQHSKLNFNLKNLSEANFYIQLQLISRKASVSQASIDRAFSIDFTEGMVVAHSEVLVGIMFTPFQVFNYDIQLVVNSKDKNPRANNKRPKQHFGVYKCSLKVKAVGSYPTLKIVDIRNDSVSVAALWENFQISRINKELSEPLSDYQKKYLNIENLPFQEAQQLEKNLRTFNWNYGYVPSKSMKPRKIILTIQNCGGTPLDYAFKFPSDNKIQEETWADPGQPNEQEAYEKAILSKNIFQIKPKADSLPAGVIRDIELIYKPVNITREDSLLKRKRESNNEKHQLKVVFQIANGKPLVLNLKGMTMGANQGLVVVKKNHYSFTPAPIGLLVPIKFPIEIQNVGSGKVSYQARLTGVLREHDQAIFNIKNGAGSLSSGEKQYLYCLFKPLQIKKYTFQVKVLIFDFVKQSQQILLTVDCEGYHRLGKHYQIRNSPAQLSEIPGQRSLVSEIGSKVFFSMQEIDFGVMSLGKTATRMIILYNLSKNNSFYFDFNTTSSSIKSSGLTCGDAFQIQPSSGEIEPQKWVELKLFLVAKTPSIYEGEIECSIAWGKKESDREKQKSGIALTNFEKETLFLRIKKACKLDISELNEKRDPEFRFLPGDDKKSLIDCLKSNLMLQLINEKSLRRNRTIKDSYNYKLLQDLDDEQPARIEQLSRSDDSAISMPMAWRNYKVHNYLFFHQEFIQVAQMIMQNTFFNIIQETTRKQNDMLREAKRFLSVNQ